MRIISLAPSNTEILYRIGAGNQIVATTSLCDHPEEAAKKPSIGGWTNPSIERVKEFNPDLVVASDDLQDNAVEKIRHEDFPVLQVKPHTLEQVYNSWRKIGKALGREENAEKLVKEVKRELEKFRLEDSPRIYCEEWMDPSMVSGNWIPDLIRKIGGDYFIEKGRSRKFEVEKLKNFNPEYIFLNICGAGENLEKKQILNRKDWEDISAVKNQNIYVLDDSYLNRPGPRILEGAKRIKECLNN